MANLGDLVYRIVCKDEASAGVNAAAANVSRAGLAIGTGMTAAGAAMVALTDGNRKMDASFKTTALSMGVSAESVKELGRSLQSVDSPISEVAATLDILARAGMDNVDSMGRTATAFDTLADATGQNADTLTDAMVPAFAALNIELADAPQYVDGLATTFRTANVDLGDFSQLMSRVGPDLGKMGLGLQDVETILMALADKGITGRKAMSTLSAAIEEADGDTAKLYASIGITNTELGTYSQKLADSAGSAQKFADAQNEQFGVIDRIGFEFGKLAQTAGDWLKPFEGVGTALTIIGPALAGAAGAMEIYSAAQATLAGTSLTSGGALAAFGTSLGIVAAEAPIVATEMVELGVSSAGAGLAMLEAGAGANVMAEGLAAAELTAAAGGAEFIGLSAGSAGAAASLATAGVAADTAAVGLTAAGIGASEAAVGLGAVEVAAAPLTGGIAALVLPLAAVAGGTLLLDQVWKENGWYKTGPGSVKQAFDEGRIAIDQTTGSIAKLTDVSAGNAIAAGEMATQYDSVTGALVDSTAEIAAQNREIAAGIPQYDSFGIAIETAGTNAGIAEQQYDGMGNAIETAGTAAATANPQYDAMGTYIGESAEAAARAAPQLGEVATATANAATAAAEGGPKYKELVDKIAKTGEASDIARKQYADMLLAIGRTADYVDGAISKLSDLEIAQRTFNGTQATSYDVYKAGMQAGSPPIPTDFQSPQGYIDALEEWQDSLGLIKSSPASSSPSSGTSGSTPTTPTWAGQNDPDYGGGNPGYASGQIDDPRLNGVASSYKEIQTEAPKTADTIKAVTKSITDQTTAADEMGPILTTVSEKTSDLSREQQTVQQALDDTATKCGTASYEYIALAERAVSLGMMSQSTVDALMEQATRTEAAGTAAQVATPAIAGLGQVFYDASGAAYTLQAPLDAANAALFASGQTAQGSVAGISAHQQAVLGMWTETVNATNAAYALEQKIIAEGLAAAGMAPAVDAASASHQVLADKVAAADQNVAGLEQQLAVARTEAELIKPPVDAAGQSMGLMGEAGSTASPKVHDLELALEAAKRQADLAKQAMDTAGTAATTTGAAAVAAVPSIQAPVGAFNAAATAAGGFAQNAEWARRALIDWNNTTPNTSPGESERKNYAVGSDSHTVKEKETFLLTGHYHSGGLVTFPGGADEGYAKLLSGETVVSRADTDGGLGEKVAAAVSRALAPLLSGPGGGGDVTIRGDLNLSADYPYPAFRSDVSEWKAARIRKGVF